MKKLLTCMISVALLSSCVCSCSKKTEDPVVTSIVYVGPNGQIYDQPYEASYEETALSRVDDKSYSETEITVSSTVIDTESEDVLIDNAISNAESLLSEGKYAQALASLIEVKSRVSDQSKIFEEENRINSYRPVNLYDLSPMTKTKGFILDPIKWGPERVVNTGESGLIGWGATTHECIYLSSFAGRSHCVTSASYGFYIQGKYDQLSGDFYLSGEKESHKNTPMSLSLNVYADDVLIYSSEELTSGSLPISVLVDIPSGCQVLVVEFVTSTTNIEGYICKDTQYGSALVNAYLSKKYVPLV